MSEKEKKWQRIYDLLNAKTKPKFFFFVYRIQKGRKMFLQKKSVLKKKRVSGGLNKKQKGSALATAIKKDPTTSIRKHANELKVHKKTVRTALKQDLSPDHNPFWLCYIGHFRKQNKCNFPLKYWFP